jgi:hypothetical protein
MVTLTLFGLLQFFLGRLHLFSESDADITEGQTVFFLPQVAQMGEY